MIPKFTPGTRPTGGAASSGGASAPPSGRVGTKICKFFATKAGCKNGTNCTFRHVRAPAGHPLSFLASSCCGNHSVNPSIEDLGGEDMFTGPNGEDYKGGLSHVVSAAVSSGFCADEKQAEEFKDWLMEHVPNDYKANLGF